MHVGIAGVDLKEFSRSKASPQLERGVMQSDPIQRPSE